LFDCAHNATARSGPKVLLDPSPQPQIRRNLI
jgi:hypothetical protein